MKIFKRIIGLMSLCLLISIISGKAQIQNQYNFSFERIDNKHQPSGWIFQNSGCTVRLDTSVVYDGKYALNILKTDSGENTFGAAAYTIPANYRGTRIKLTGFIKTENIENGLAGLSMRIDGSEKQLAFDDMDNRGVHRTTDWKEYSIELPYDSVNAKQIVVGASLSGSGKMWVDDLHIYLDNKPIEVAPAKELLPAARDTSFSTNSGTTSIILNRDKIKLLTNLGMIWGFLKYYHPAIIQGKYNWDAELFRHLPLILKAPDNKTAYKIIEQWIDSLGAVPACKNCALVPADKIKQKPDYGYLFIAGNLPKTLKEKLKFIRDNYKPVSEQYYISKFPSIGSAVFQNELLYENSRYVDAGTRLIGLYRFWNIIQYFFPSRYLIGEDWNKVLPEFIPKFINAKDDKEYTSACLEIIARIHDTHANIWWSNYSTALDSIKGMYMTPFQAKFIQNKLIVTNYYKDTFEIKNKIHIGDIIEKIDGIPVDSLIKKYLPLTPASNYDAQLRDMPSANGFLLRSNKQEVNLQIRNNDTERQITISKVSISKIDQTIDYSDPTQTSGYKMLPGNIGYIYPGKLTDTDIFTIKKQFADTKGLIIDLRVYPAIMDIAVLSVHGSKKS
ncbi:hypothetical protein [Arachidicoccus ginsenosidimutans]|uniref:hypothetical protein n=1 Tax=Arachidicoccus sp. BS20 TaxID=1850526 RepID=UPI0018D276AF|nr:hypothetical protein [Arachidicoccus sp. BS20]